VIGREWSVWSHLPALAGSMYLEVCNVEVYNGSIGARKAHVAGCRGIRIELRVWDAAVEAGKPCLPPGRDAPLAIKAVMPPVLVVIAREALRSVQDGKQVVLVLAPLPILRNPLSMACCLGSAVPLMRLA
jgi:hypothetical protein